MNKGVKTNNYELWPICSLKLQNFERNKEKERLENNGRVEIRKDGGIHGE